MPFLQHDDVRLYFEYEPSSSRPVLLLSNSLGTDLSMWSTQMPAFAEHFSVLRYDARGHGRSSTPEGPYSIEVLASDVLALLDALALPRVRFCGLSMGGMVGQWLAVHAPERLDRLVLSNTAAKIGNAEGWNERISAVLTGGMAAVVPAVLERWYTAAFRKRSPEVVRATEGTLLASNPSGYAASCAAVRDMDLRPYVSNISTPSLIIYGLEDPVTPPEEAHWLARHIAGSRELALPAAHLANIEAADEFTTGVLEFLRSDA